MPTPSSILATVLLAAGLAAQERPAARPNILLIMVDDMGWADLSCYGSRVLETPRIDQLAAQGMHFTQAYSGCTVCAPARSTLLTGTHMGHTSVRLNTGGVPLRDEDVTIAEVLSDAGYICGGFGKWGLGELGTEGVPERQGFDTFFGYYHQIHAHYHLPEYLIRNGEKVALPGNAGFYDRYPHGLAGDGGFAPVDADSGRERAFAPQLVFEATKAFIAEQAGGDRPFFCYAAWTLPHGEYKVPDDDPAWAKYSAREWPVRARVVAAYDTIIDRHVGQLLDLLDDLEIAEETVVMFCSDHGGDDDYDDLLDSCGPLRGKKRSMYEGGLRVPLIVRWPGRIEAGAGSSLLCYFPDFLPTFAELGGAEVPSGIDGISFAPTLLGESEQPLHDYLYWEWARYDWGRGELVTDGLMQAVRVGDLKAVRLRQDAAVELYDLATDLGETTDLAATRPDDVARLAGVMDRARVPMREQAEPPRVEGRPFR